jgi:hypothetical protein
MLNYVMRFIYVHFKNQPKASGFQHSPLADISLLMWCPIFANKAVYMDLEQTTRYGHQQLPVFIMLVLTNSSFLR